MLEYRCKVDQSHAGPRDPIVDGVVLGRVGRTDSGQCTVILGGFVSDLLRDRALLVGSPGVIICACLLSVSQPCRPSGARA